jgi:hypothetical protein
MPLEQFLNLARGGNDVIHAFSASVFDTTPPSRTPAAALA